MQEYHDLRMYSNTLRIAQKRKSPETAGQVDQVRSMVDMHQRKAKEPRQRGVSAPTAGPVSPSSVGSTLSRSVLSSLQE